MSKLTTLRRGPIEATIDSHGAQLVSLRLDGRQYLWQRDPRWWSSSAPVLFPIVGSLHNDHAVSSAGEVRLRRHGLARNLDHELVDATRGHATYELDSTPETRELYPFDFRLSLSYRVTQDSLQQSFTVTNTGDVPMPFVVGGHPAFNVPLPRTDEGFDDYELRFAAKWSYDAPTLDHATGILDFDNRWNVLSNSNRLPLSHGLFACDTIVFEDVPDSTVTLMGTKSGHGVELDFDGFPYLGVWSAEHDAPFVAVEPWTGCASATDEVDAFDTKRGMRTLAPGASWAGGFRICPF